MNRFLVIDHDRAASQKLGLACIERGVGVLITDTVCEGVRVLMSASVSLILVDGTLMRLSAREHAALFERVAPGVPVVVVLSPTASLDTRVTFDLAGFRVLTRPVTVEDLLEKVVAEKIAG
jgi:DNA-binding response OmpR family regulator